MWVTGDPVTRQIRCGVWGFAFLMSSQGMPTLLVGGPHFGWQDSEQNIYAGTAYRACGYLASAYLSSLRSHPWIQPPQDTWACPWPLLPIPSPWHLTSLWPTPSSDSHTLPSYLANRPESRPDGHILCKPSTSPLQDTFFPLPELIIPSFAPQLSSILHSAWWHIIVYMSPKQTANACHSLRHLTWELLDQWISISHIKGGLEMVPRSWTLWKPGLGLTSVSLSAWHIVGALCNLLDRKAWALRWVCFIHLLDGPLRPLPTGREF